MKPFTHTTVGRVAGAERLTNTTSGNPQWAITLDGGARFRTRPDSVVAGRHWEGTPGLEYLFGLIDGQIVAVEPVLYDSDGSRHVVPTFGSGAKYVLACVTCMGHLAREETFFPPHRIKATCLEPKSTRAPHCTCGGCF